MVDILLYRICFIFKSLEWFGCWWIRTGNRFHKSGVFTFVCIGLDVTVILLTDYMQRLILSETFLWSEIQNKKKISFSVWSFWMVEHHRINKKSKRTKTKVSYNYAYQLNWVRLFKFKWNVQHEHIFNLNYAQHNS